MQLQATSAHVCNSPHLLHGKESSAFTCSCFGTRSKLVTTRVLAQRLHDQCVVMLEQDSFYKGLSPQQKAAAAGAPCHGTAAGLCVDLQARPCRG